MSNEQKDWFADLNSSLQNGLMAENEVVDKESMDEFCEQNRTLIYNFPWLLPYEFKDKIDNYDYSLGTILDDIPYGWKKSFGLEMCKEIQAELERFNTVYKYRVAQAKENMGNFAGMIAAIQ